MDAGHLDATTHPNAKAQITAQLTSAGGATLSANKFRGAAANLESLSYYITSIQICESIELQGSGFGNPQGCLELYRRDIGELAYGLDDDWRPLADVARRTTSGYVDLLDAQSRAQLATTRELTAQDARSYQFGVITWALPVKLRGSVPFLDGTRLYTHDGVTTFETVGVDNFRAYYTTPNTPLDQAPAEEAVVLLGNGGNWFKFQQPLTISAADIEAKRGYVLDLVFNPDGIVNGYADSWAMGNLSQRSSGGQRVYDITVPLLDLAPVPHAADQRVVRESYRGTTAIGGNAFDVRIELYAIEGEEGVYGADMKTLVNPVGTGVPPSMVKASFVDREADGTLSFSSFKHIPAVTGLRRLTTLGSTTQVAITCGEHTDREAAEGGKALIVDHCPSAALDVTLTLVSRNIVEGALPITTLLDGGTDGSVVDASSLLDAN